MPHSLTAACFTLLKQHRGAAGPVIAFTWYLEVIKQIGSTRTAAFINLFPLFAVLQGVLLLDERLGNAVLLGGAIVMIGVFITNRPANTANT